MATTDPISYIQEELFRRQELDGSYSARDFSKVLGISSGRLSELLSGKRNLTLKMGERMADAIGMDPTTETEFKNSIIGSKKVRTKTTRVYNNLQKDEDTNYRQLNQDIFELISKQQYYAILNLINTKSFCFDTVWMSDRLSIPQPTIDKSIALMCRLGILKVEEGKLVRVKKKLKTTDDMESRAIKNAHREKLQHSLVCLETIPVELRDITSISCPIDMSKLPQVKELIKDFRRGLAKFMEEGDCDEVYNINIQLVPLTNVKTGKYQQ